MTPDVVGEGEGEGDTSSVVDLPPAGLSTGLMAGNEDVGQPDATDDVG